MSADTSINLDDHSGRETRLEALRSALIAGEESGVPEPFDFAVFVLDNDS